MLDWLPVLNEARYIDPILESLRFLPRKEGVEALRTGHHAESPAPDRFGGRAAARGTARFQAVHVADDPRPAEAGRPGEFIQYGGGRHKSLAGASCSYFGRHGGRPLQRHRCRAGHGRSDRPGRLAHPSLAMGGQSSSERGWGGAGTRSVGCAHGYRRSPLRDEKEVIGIGLQRLKPPGNRRAPLRGEESLRILATSPAKHCQPAAIRSVDKDEWVLRGRQAMAPGTGVLCHN